MNSQEQTSMPLPSRPQSFQRRVGVQSANGTVQSAPPIHRTVVTFGDHCAYKWIAKTNDYGEGLLLVTAAERVQQGFNWDDAVTLPVLADECFDLLAVLLKCRSCSRSASKTCLRKMPGGLARAQCGQTEWLAINCWRRGRFAIRLVKRIGMKSQVNTFPIRWLMG